MLLHASLSLCSRQFLLSDGCMHGFLQSSTLDVIEEEAMGTMVGQSHVVQPTYQNALGRASVGRVTEAQMQRASVVRRPLLLTALTVIFPPPGCVLDAGIHCMQASASE